MLQVYQVYHQLSPWYIYSICTWFKLHDPGPSVTSYKCTRSIINYHPGTYIQYAHGSSYMTQGLLSHPTSVPGLSSTIALVHIINMHMVQVTWPRAFCHILQVYQVYHQLSPWYIYSICTWFKLHDPGPSVTSYKCTRSVINYHPGVCCCSYQLQPRCTMHCDLVQSYTTQVCV